MAAPTLSDVWKLFIKGSSLRRLALSLKCKLILHTAALVVFLVLSFISFLYLESVTVMKPKLLNLAFQSPPYQAPNLALHYAEASVGAPLGGWQCGGVVGRQRLWGRG